MSVTWLGFQGRLNSMASPAKFFSYGVRFQANGLVTTCLETGTELPGRTGILFEQKMNGPKLKDTGIDGSEFSWSLGSFMRDVGVLMYRRLKGQRGERFVYTNFKLPFR